MVEFPETFQEIAAAREGGIRIVGLSSEVQRLEIFLQPSVR